MHPEARQFVFAASRKVARKMSPSTALEVGARDVNGNCREYFPQVKSWYGIDLKKGPNVDEVADAETWVPPTEYDLVLCTETLEHAERPDLIVGMVHEALAPGGFFVMTCAGVGRRPHNCDGDHPAVMTEHYSNISVSQMEEWLGDLKFQHYAVEANHVAKDLYALARK